MNLKQLTFSICILLSSALYAMDTIYFDKYQAEINNPKKTRGKGKSMIIVGKFSKRCAMDTMDC